MVIRTLTIGICLLFAAGFGMFFFSRFFPRSITIPSPTQIKQLKPMSDISADMSHNISPFKSNQWYTSALQSFPSQPLYAMPLAYRLTVDGVGISYPKIKKTEKAIFAPYTEDLSVGFTKQFTKTELEAAGDWHVNLSLVTSDSKKLSFFLAHGVPYTTVQSNGQNLVLSFPNTFTVIDQNKTEVKEKNVTTDSFVVVTNGREYVFVLPSKKNILIAKQTITIPAVETLVVGGMSDRKEFDEFVQLRGSTITGTFVEPMITDETITTDYRLLTNKGTPLIALYPHHYNNVVSVSSLPTVGIYETLRGPMRLVKTDFFTTTLPKRIPVDTFTPLSTVPDDLRKSISADIAAFINSNPPDSKNYFLGTWFGKGVNLLLLADSHKMDKERKELLTFLKPVFINSLNYFSYDANKKSVFSEQPEFGNEKYNDHHFHYGYFIRTGAVLAKLDPTVLTEIKKPMQMMVDDIATFERKSTSYPFLRNFDVYEGHSWADGYANFADGNNQESTSEAINAWYGVYLWSRVTKNSELEKYALYVYHTEIESTKQYWFDESNIYTSPYGHEIASIVWGGKVDFATWFSPQVSSIYGIQLLPFTPASSYLGELSSFEEYDKDFYDNGGKDQEAWGDLFVMWKSFYYPKEMLARKDALTKYQDANTRSMLLYILYKNAK